MKSLKSLPIRNAILIFSKRVWNTQRKQYKNVTNCCFAILVYAVHMPLNRPRKSIIYKRRSTHFTTYILYFYPFIWDCIAELGIEILKPYCKLIKFTFLTIWNSAAFFNDLFPCTISVFATEYHIELGKGIKK